MSKQISLAETSSAEAEVVSRDNEIFPTKIISKEEFEAAAKVLKWKAGCSTSKKIDETTLYMEICGSRDGRFKNVSIRYDVEMVGLAPNELVVDPSGAIIMCVGVEQGVPEPNVYFVLGKSSTGVVFWSELKKAEDFIKAGFVKISTSAG